MAHLTQVLLVSHCFASFLTVGVSVPESKIYLFLQFSLSVAHKFSFSPACFLSVLSSLAYYFWFYLFLMALIKKQELSMLI